MKIHRLTGRASWLVVSLLTLGWCSMASAQSPEPGDDDANAEEDSNSEDSEMGVVVVTAERRDEPLQTTPIAATVLSGEELVERGINVVDHLMFVTPSATVNNFGQGIDFNIRGIGKGEHNTQTTTGVITYRDGVATFPGYFTGEPYYDIATVEILRGPQGTFSGENATGGAVFVNSNDPVIDGGYTGYLQGLAGNYSDLGLQGALNIPISETLAARVAMNTENRDSFWDIEGPYTGTDARLRSRSGRVGLLWTPTDELSVLFKYDYNDLDFGAYPADPVNAPNDIFDITANGFLKARDIFSRSVLRADYEFDGGTVFRSTTGYQDGNTAYGADLDGTQFFNRIFRDSVDEEILSQEFNLISSQDDAWSWIVGAYFQQDDYEFLPDEFIIGIPEGNPATEYRLEGTNERQTNAAFGQVGFQLSERWEIELGARYTDHRTTNDVDVLQYGTPITADQTERYSDTSGKLALNWEVSDRHFLYGFIATGFKPGGLNVNVGLGNPAPFDEEKVTSFETGWKASWNDDHVRTQVTAFYNDYENFQVIIGNPTIPVFGLEVNVPDTTKIYGAEAEIQAFLGDFRFDAGVGWMRSELGAFFATDPRIPAFAACDPETGPQSASCIDLEGRDQTYAPDFTFNAGLQYDFHVGSGVITPRISYAHVGEQWATLFQNEARGDRIESRNITNAQIAWQHDDWVVTLYGTNLSDEHYVAAINSGLRFAGYPRTYGLRVLWTF